MKGALGLPAGVVMFMASCVGSARPESSAPGRVALTQAPGPAAGQREPAAIRGGSPADDELAGRVVTPAGEPIAGARVRVVEPLSRQWPTFFESAELRELEREVAVATTDEGGGFRLDVPPNRVLDLAIAAAGFAGVELPGRYGGEELDVVLARGASVSGRVTRGPGGAAVGGALVEARQGVISIPGARAYSTRTDAGGRYRLGGLPPGFYHVWSGNARFDETLGEGEEAQRDLVLPASTSLTGRLTDGRNEEPIAGARVWLGSNAEQAALTDATGVYRIDGMPLDEAWGDLHASAQGYGTFEMRVEVSGGGSVRDMFLLPGRRARGRVVDEHGEAVAGAFLTAAARDSGPPDYVERLDARSTRTDADGRFELTDLRIDLRHTLLVRAEGFASAVFDLPASEWDLTELELGDLPLEPPTLVCGGVTDLGGRALTGLFVFAEVEPAQRDRLGPSDGGQGYLDGFGGQGRIGARTDARGRFVFAGLPAGRWRVWSDAKGWVHGGELELELGPGERRTDLVIASDPGLSISGVVVDEEGRALPGIVVNVTTADRSFRIYDLSREDGSFSVHALEPGSYQVDTEPFGQDVASATQGVFAAGTADLRLVVERAVSIRVRVVDRLGASLPGAHVGVLLSDGSTALIGCDREGRAKLQVPAHSPFDLRAFANRYFAVNPDYLTSFFLDDKGEVIEDTTVTVRGLVAGPDEIVLTIPGLP